MAIDLLTDWGWQRSIPNYDVVREFTIPFVRAANHVRYMAAQPASPPWTRSRKALPC